MNAGIEPLDVLRIATTQAAEAVAAKDDLGTLKPGKLADKNRWLQPSATLVTIRPCATIRILTIAQQKQPA